MAEDIILGYKVIYLEKQLNSLAARVKELEEKLDNTLDLFQRSAQLNVELAEIVKSINPNPIIINMGN